MNRIEKILWHLRIEYEFSHPPEIKGDIVVFDITLNLKNDDVIKLEANWDLSGIYIEDWEYTINVEEYEFLIKKLNDEIPDVLHKNFSTDLKGDILSNNKD